MDKYYYIIAQLPRLVFNKPDGHSEKDFLAEAGKWLGKRDLGILSSIDLDGSAPFKKGPRVWQAFQVFEQTFRDDIAAWRKARHDGQDYKPSQFPLSLIKEGNPLEIERKLLEFRWNFLDAMEKDHHFDIDVLVLYMLKLKILSRLSLFSREKGQAVFDKLIQENPNPPGTDNTEESELENVEKESR
jgi:hypothetical protein